MKRLNTIGILGTVLCAASLASCVTMKVNRLPVDADAAPSETGEYVYALPQTVIAVNGTITLNDCDETVATLIDPAGTAQRRSDNNGPMPIDVTENFTVSSYVVADPQFQFSIPYAELRSVAKQINLSVGRYPNKTLQTINAAITDQVGPIATAAVQAIVSVGGAATVPGVSPISPSVFLTRADVDQQILPFDRVLIEHSLAKQGGSVAIAELMANSQISGVSKQELLAIHDEKVKQLVPPSPTPVCNEKVLAALTQIGKLSRDIAILQQKASDKKDDGAGAPAATPVPVPSPPLPTNAMILRDQAKIAQLISANQLVRQVNTTWIPSRNEIDAKDDPKDTHQVTAFFTHQLNLFEDKIAANWLAGDLAGHPQERQQAKDAIASFALTQALTKNMYLTLAVKNWTLGHDFCDPSSDAPSCLNHSAGHDWGGLVMRDPALGVLRVCAGMCQGFDDSKLDIDNTSLDVTADASTPLSVPIAQFGKISIHPLRNVLFEASSITTTINADATIATIGNTSSNAVAGATGAGAVTAAANSQMGVVAARNSAIGSENTALITATGAVDAANKSLADCLAQQLLIVNAGGRPIGKCQ